MAAPILEVIQNPMNVKRLKALSGDFVILLIQFDLLGLFLIRAFMHYIGGSDDP